MSVPCPLSQLLLKRLLCNFSEVENEKCRGDDETRREGRMSTIVLLWEERKSGEGGGGEVAISW